MVSYTSKLCVYFTTDPIDQSSCTVEQRWFVDHQWPAFIFEKLITCWYL